MEQRYPENVIEDALALLDAGDREQTARFLDALDSNQLLKLLNQFDDEAFRRTLSVVGSQRLADRLAALDPEDAVLQLARLDISQVADLMERMDPDDAADVLNEMDDTGAARTLAEMVPAASQEARALLSYPPDTAGGLMTPEFVSVKADWTVGDTVRYLRTQAHEAETIYVLYVTDEQERLQGVVSLRDLILAGEYDRLSDILNPEVVHVHVDDDQEEAAGRIMEADLLALPVVDFNQRLIGIVTVDDALDVLEEEYGEDMLKFGAIEGGEERALSSPRYSIRHRLPWLLANIGLSMIGVFVVGAFQNTLAQVIVLATFMPVISNMGGNVGIQAVSVAIRGISTGEVSFFDFWSVLRKELLVGFFNGLVLGVLLGTIAWALHHNVYLGVVTTVGLWASVVVASVCGGTLPFFLKRLGQDPAMATGPLLTTIVDVISFFIFLGLGTLMLSAL